jgi:hypothetical protein
MNLLFLSLSNFPFLGRRNLIERGLANFYEKKQMKKAIWENGLLVHFNF